MESRYSSTHLTDIELERYVNDDLLEGESAIIGKHVDECASCLAEVEAAFDLRAEQMERDEGGLPTDPVARSCEVRKRARERLALLEPHITACESCSSAVADMSERSVHDRSVEVHLYYLQAHFQPCSVDKLFLWRREHTFQRMLSDADQWPYTDPTRLRK